MSSTSHLRFSPSWVSEWFDDTSSLFFWTKRENFFFFFLGKIKSLDELFQPIWIKFSLSVSDLKDCPSLPPPPQKKRGYPWELRTYHRMGRSRWTYQIKKKNLKKNRPMKNEIFKTSSLTLPFLMTCSPSRSSNLSQSWPLPSSLELPSTKVIHRASLLGLARSKL